MMKVKRVLALLLCLAMLLSIAPINSLAADGTANVEMSIDKEEVQPGDTITVVLSYNDMTVKSFGAYIQFDLDKLTCTSVTGARNDKDKYKNSPYLLDIDEDWIKGTSLSNPEKANANGQVGFAYGNTEDWEYMSSILFTATFVVKDDATGNLNFSSYEDSNGPSGYQNKDANGENIAIETKTVTIGSTEPAPPECEHTSTKLVSNADGKTHNVVCTNEACNGYVVRTENCSGTDDGDHTTAVMCDCGNTVTAATAHKDENPKNHICDFDGCNFAMGEHKSNAAHTCLAGKCDYCGADMPATTDHNYIPGTPVWSDNNTKCTVTGTCACGDTRTAVTTNISTQVTTEANCQTPEGTTHTATFTEPWVGSNPTTGSTGNTNPNKHPQESISTKDETTPATCTEEGKVETVTFCSACNREISRTLKSTIPAGTGCELADPTYNWSSDYATCTAEVKCQHGTVHKTETVNTTSSVTTEGTCQTAKVVTYTADFTSDWAENQTKEVTGEKNPDNHAEELIYSYGNESEHFVYYPCCYEYLPEEKHSADENGYCVCGAFAVVQDFNGGKVNPECSMEDMTAEEWASAVEQLFGGFDATKWVTFGAPGEGFVPADMTPESIAMMNAMIIKEGYVIVGMAYDAEGTQPYNGEEITEPATLYLIWEPLHVCTHDHYAYINNAEGHVSVCSCGKELGYPEGHELGENDLCACGAWLLTIDYNGGKSSENPGKDGNKYYFEPGLVYNFAWNEEGCKEVYAKEGYVFAGYAYDAEGQNPVVNPTELSSTTTVYVVWECTHDQDVYEYTYTDNRDGTHTVKCACGETLKTTEAHDYTTGDAAHTCICGAVEQITINIYWDGELKWPLTANYGTQSSVPTGPSPTGYKFVGFAKTEGGEVFLPAGEDITYTENLDLYPVFKAETFTLSFDLNGGTLADEYNEFEAYVQDGKFILPGIKYGAPAEYNEFYQEGWLVKEGYHITGFEDEDGNFHSLESDDVFTMTGDTTLAVVWEVNTYTLTVNILMAQHGVEGLAKQVALTVPYGANLLEVLAQAEAERKIPATGQKYRLKTARENGEVWNWGYLYDIGEWDDWVYAGLTMPAGDFAVDQSYGFNGWMIDEVGSEYWLESDEYSGTILGWHYIEDDYDDVAGGAWYYFALSTLEEWVGRAFRAEGLTRAPYPTEEINGWTYEADADALAYDPSFIDKDEAWFLFDEDGKFQYGTNGDIGWYEINDANELRYMNHGMLEWHPGLIKNGDDYYYFIGDVVNGGNIAAEGDTYITKNNGNEDFAIGDIYNFAEGELSGAHGIVDGKYYENSRLMTGNGLTEIQVEGETKFIYVRSNGYIVVNADYYVPANNKGVVPGTYSFDENGYLINPELTGKDGIYFENGAWYYYENGKICYNKGLIEVTETWYDGEGTNEMTAVIYVRSNGQLAMGYYYVTNMANYNGSVAIVSGTKLLFDNYGAMAASMNGIVDGYYYQNNQIVYNAGVVEIEDGKYIYVRSNGEVVMNRNYWITNVGDTGVVAKLYTFDEHGYFTPEFVSDQKDGIVNGYYYENGAIAYGKGIVKLTDENGVDFYIYVRSNGQLATGIYWPTTTNGYDFSGRYDFGNDGKLYI